MHGAAPHGTSSNGRIFSHSPTFFLTVCLPGFSAPVFQADGTEVPTAGKLSAADGWQDSAVFPEDIRSFRKTVPECFFSAHPVPALALAAPSVLSPSAVFLSGPVLSVSFLRLFAAFVFLQYLFFVLPVVPPMSALFSLPLSALLFFLLPAHFLSHFPPSGARTLLPGGSFSAAVSMFPVMPRKAESAPPASVPHTRPSARQLRKATILFHSLLRRQIPLLLSEPAPGSKKEETGRCRR